MKVSRKAEHLIGSEIIRFAGEINARKAQGETIYNLTIGDFNPALFPIPEELKQGIINAYNAGQTNYPPSNGIQELRESVARFLAHRGGLSYDANEILISCGARPLIYAVYQALIDPNDKVIFPVPSWNNNHYSHLSDAQKVYVYTTPENNFMPSAEDIAPHIEGATLVALCSPLNPTGTTFNEEQLGGICDLILEENKRRGPDEKPLYLLYDQIYWGLTYGETQHFDPVSLRPEIRPYTLFIDGISKAFCATGVRVGWSFGPTEVIAKMKSINGHVGAWAPRAEQAATAAYLSNHDAVDTFLIENRKKLFQRLNGFYDGLQTLKAEGFPVDAISPQAAIYLTIKFDLVGWTTPEGTTLNTNREVHQYILDKAKLAIIPFYAFGASEDAPWYRLSVGTAVIDEIPLVIDGLRKMLADLKQPVTS